jgi:1-acyl-sn-glycerol-3-phosphate acyltransferase
MGVGQSRREAVAIRGRFQGVTSKQYRLGRALLTAMGWRTTGRAPDAPKHVLVAAPHTSAWDMPMFPACSDVWACRST